MRSISSPGPMCGKQRRGCRLALGVLILASPSPGAEPDPEKDFLRLLQRQSSTPQERRAAFQSLRKTGKHASKALKSQLARSWDGALKGLDSAAVQPALERELKELQPALVQAGERMQVVVEAKEASKASIDEVLAAGRKELDGLYRQVQKEPGFARAKARVGELGEYCAWAGLNRGFPSTLGTTLARLAFMRTFAASTHHPVFDYNHSMRAILDPEEAECIERTNIHRLELGLRPLEIDLRLVMAARKHAEEMTEKSYFSHDSPTPKLSSPWMRAAREGVRAASENIAGAGDAASAFASWFYSAPHHKNMIKKDAASIGIGIAGHNWTEMLGLASLHGQQKALKELEYARLRYEAGNDVERIVRLAQWCQASKLLTQAEDELERALRLKPDHKAAQGLLERLKPLLPK